MTKDKVDLFVYHEILQELLYKIENDSRKAGLTEKEIFMIAMGFLWTHSIVFYLRIYSGKDKEFFMQSISKLYDGLAPVIAEEKKR